MNSALSEVSNTVQYYRSMTGRWQGEYRFAITEWQAMKRAVPAGSDRLRMIVFHCMGSQRIATSVRFEDATTVKHTTRIEKWRVPVFISTEWFLLNENGKTFTVKMAQRLAPFFRRLRHFENGTGIVEDSQVGAAYQLPWIGGEINQKVLIVDDGVQLAQTTGWFRAQALLRRCD